MVVSTTHPDAMDYRKYVIEWLMLDHPLDCPVCDEGGHCLLQDETVSGGHGIRRFLGPKRTYRDQHLGLFVQHEMNRCIQCWRCRRFYQEYAGYRDLGALQIGRRTYFGRFSDGALESPFAGNLIDVCPTGVFTDKPSRFKGRRWNFERGPSLCLHCSLGCNTVGSAQYREMVRLEGRQNDAVNGFFICDRGRYGFGYANHPERPRRARRGGQEVPWDEAIEAAAAELARISREHGPHAVACVGGARSSLETQGALKLFCRTQGWRDPQFFWDSAQERKVKAAVGRLDQRLAVSMRQLEAADFILLAGADPVNEAPMLAIALRQAQRRGAQVTVLDPRPVFLPCEFEPLPVPPGRSMPPWAPWSKAPCPPKRRRGSSSPPAASMTPCPAGIPGTRRWRTGWPRWPGPYKKAKGRWWSAAPTLCGKPRRPSPRISPCSCRAPGKTPGLFYLLPGANAFGAALVSAPDPPDGRRRSGRPVALGPGGGGGTRGPGRARLERRRHPGRHRPGRDQGPGAGGKRPLLELLRRGAAGLGPGKTRTPRRPGLSALAQPSSGPTCCFPPCPCSSGRPGASSTRRAGRNPPRQSISGERRWPSSAPRSIRPGRFSTTFPGAIPGPRRRFFKS